MTPNQKMRDTDLSKLKKTTTRVNKQNLLHIVLPTNPVAKEQPVRKRLPGEATSPANDLWDRPRYKTGDGDTVAFQRPNSNHSHIKSRGNPT